MRAQAACLTQLADCILTRLLMSWQTATGIHMFHAARLDDVVAECMHQLLQRGEKGEAGSVHKYVVMGKGHDKLSQE